ncbi:MAG: mechanosensitive ion channel [Blastocatellia bacterium]|nr:mechanosensitive ion channel [Blastocatellia bacterium]
MGEWLRKILFWFEFPLVHVGKTEITAWTLVNLSFLLVMVYYLAGRIRKWLIEGVPVINRLELGARVAIGTIARYVVLLIGVLVALQTVGIDLTTFNVLAGAVGIGIGFGLQNVANNFISGLIILFERPIKVGDRIEVGPIDGDVVEIGARSTTVLTNDNIAIIIPNSKFISENITNWKYNDAKVRFRIPVGVSYASDVQFVKRLLIEVAAQNPDTLHDPPPLVWFRGFGPSSLDFELLVWNSTLVHRRWQFVSDLNFSIFETFQRHGIEIPFPQREVHIRTGLVAPEPEKPGFETPQGGA